MDLVEVFSRIVLPWILSYCVSLNLCSWSPSSFPSFKAISSISIFNRCNFFAWTLSFKHVLCRVFWTLLQLILGFVFCGSVRIFVSTFMTLDLPLGIWILNKSARFQTIESKVNGEAVKVSLIARRCNRRTGSFEVYYLFWGIEMIGECFQMACEWRYNRLV